MKKLYIILIILGLTFNLYADEVLTGFDDTNLSILNEQLRIIKRIANNVPTISLTSGVTGTLPILNGGTGQTTASTAINALLPSQTGNTGLFLTTNGSSSSWDNLATGILVQVFTENGTFTAPTGVTKAYLTMVGGGGGGYGGYGYGGGGGAAVINYPYIVTPGNEYAVVVGAGGAGGSSEENGSAGGVTSFDSAISVAGGGGGTELSSAGGAGGYNASGDTGGGYRIAGGNGAAQGGGGSALGQGATLVTYDTPVNGGLYGGGGSSRDAAGVGGSGAAGICIILMERGDIGGGGGSGAGTLTTLKEGGSVVGGADIVTLDFGSGFDLTETPDTEINIALDLSEYSGYNNTNWDTAYTHSQNSTSAHGLTIANVSSLGSTISVNELASADFGDFTCNGTTCSLDTDFEEEVTEGSLADSVIVSADIKDGTIVVADTAITAGRSLTWSTNDMVADAELYTDWKGITIETPTDADNFFVFEAPIALTITRVTGIVESATSAVLTWQECDSAGDNCSTIESITADVDGTIVTSGDIDNASIDAGDIIRLDVGTVTGTVGQAHSTITFTKND